MLTIQEVMNLFSDIRLAFGESDEYSFVLHKGTTLYGMLSVIHMLTDQHLT